MFAYTRLLSSSNHKFFSIRRIQCFLYFLGVFSLVSYFIFAWSEVPLLQLQRRNKIDWNDYELMQSDSLRTGFGEHGKSGILTDPDEIKQNAELFETFGMSVIVSDKISVNRSIPDFRHPACLHKKYFQALPKVSIVIIVHNEIFSVFKRTLHSLYNRTPHQLIAEVVIVNDASTLEDHYDPLKNYIAEHFPDFEFKIINLETRQGLMEARAAGGKAARSQFVFIMEPHCEMTYNWLPPLLEPLLDEKRLVTVPIIDNVEYEFLHYYEQDHGNKGCRGLFDWKLDYQTRPRFPVEASKALDPFLTPVMTGGVFMIRREYFLELGPYDDEFLIWGAENVEMSLKIHLCGGKLLEVPCSRIGHVFRNFNTFRKHDKGIDFEHFNQKRVVDVWFDEFKEVAYRNNKKRFEIDVGDLTKAKQLRESLHCKPFKYFLEVIAPDLLQNFPLEDPVFASGRIELVDTGLCVEATSEIDERLKLENCTEPIDDLQNFEMSWYKDIRLVSHERCIDFHKTSVMVCHFLGGMQLFNYNVTTNQLINMGAQKCLTADVEGRSLKFSDCNDSRKTQKWTWSGFTNETMLKNWEISGKQYK